MEKGFRFSLLAAPLLLLITSVKNIKPDGITIPVFSGMKE